MSLRVRCGQTLSFDSKDSSEAIDSEFSVEGLSKKIWQKVEILLICVYNIHYITYISKTQKTDDTLFVCSWQMILLGPRLGSGRIWDYFSTSQQQFSCRLSLLHYKNTRVKSNFQASNSKNIPVIWDISYSLGWELFTFLDWTVDTHFLFLYSHWGLFFREALTRSCVASVEKRVTLWS